MKKIFLLVLTAILIIGLLGFYSPFQILFIICTGWLSFLFTSAASVEVNWGLVIFTFLLTGVFILVLQKTGKSWYQEWKLSQWKHQWTLSISLLLLISFAAGISFIGMAHQFFWIVFKDPPMIQNYTMKRIIARNETKNKLLIIGQAAYNFQEKYENYPLFGSDPEGEYPISWETKILPFMEQKNLYNLLDNSVPWNHSKNRLYYETIIPGFIHPEIEETNNEEHFALSHFAGNALVMARTEKLTPDDIADRTGNTFLGGEISKRFLPWGKPGNWRDPRIGLNSPESGFHGPQTGITQFVFTDGSVRTISNDMDPEVLKALSTPDGGEKVDDF